MCTFCFDGFIFEINISNNYERLKDFILYNTLRFNVLKKIVNSKKKNKLYNTYRWFEGISCTPYYITILEYEFRIFRIVQN